MEYQLKRTNEGLRGPWTVLGMTENTKS